MIKLTTGERIDDLIKKSGKSGEKVLKEINEKYSFSISKPTLSDIINDVDKGYSYKYFEVFAKYFNVSTDYLLGLSDAPTPLKTDEGKTIRAASDFTGFHSTYIELINTLKNADQSIIIELTEILTEELIFNNKLVNNLSDCKKMLPQFFLSKIDENIKNIESYETLKELLVDAESEINEYIAHITIIKNCISKTIDEYFNIGDAEKYYNIFLERKQQLLEKYNGGENYETKEEKS